MRKGFQNLSPEERKAISSRAGASVPAHKRAFSKDKALASRAGKLGGGNNRKTPKE